MKKKKRKRYLELQKADKSTYYYVFSEKYNDFLINNSRKCIRTLNNLNLWFII